MKLLGYNSTQCRFIGIYILYQTTIPVILVTIIGPILDKFFAMCTNMSLIMKEELFYILF